MIDLLDNIDRKILYLINDFLSNPIFDLFFVTITNFFLVTLSTKGENNLYNILNT